jgi:O-antigen ligase
MSSGAAPPAAPGRAEAALAALMPLAAWCTYAPLGAKYFTWLLASGLAVAVVQRQRAWRVAFAAPGPRLLLALTLWMWLSALWSAAPADRWVAHGWTHLLPLSTVLLAWACPAAAARRFVWHFAAASATVGALWWWDRHIGLPASMLWTSTVDASGNERIASSTLLAVGAALACWLASQADTPRQRWLAVALAVLATAGLTAQDRRTGMLLLPLLLTVWALTAPRRADVKAVLAIGVLAAASATWMLSDGVRARFDEGRRELLAYRSGPTAVDTSWGLRLRMAELTWQMVEERPLAGHGLGSWQMLWHQRVPPGTREADNSTPHNEYLNVATQAGVPAALLLLAWWLAMAWAALRAGRIGVPALMLWLTLALGALANAVMRDAKWALPLWLLAGLCTALMRPASIAAAPHDNRGPPAPGAGGEPSGKEHHVSTER